MQARCLGFRSNFVQILRIDKLLQRKRVFYSKRLRVVVEINVHVPSVLRQIHHPLGVPSELIITIAGCVTRGGSVPAEIAERT